MLNKNFYLIFGSNNILTRNLENYDYLNKDIIKKLCDFTGSNSSNYVSESMSIKSDFMFSSTQIGDFVLKVGHLLAQLPPAAFFLEK